MSFGLPVKEERWYYIINCDTKHCLAKRPSGNEVYMDKGRIGRSPLHLWKVEIRNYTGQMVLALQNASGGFLFYPKDGSMWSHISSYTLACIPPPSSRSDYRFDLSTSWICTFAQEVDGCVRLNTGPCEKQSVDPVLTAGSFLRAQESSGYWERLEGYIGVTGSIFDIVKGEPDTKLNDLRTCWKFEEARVPLVLASTLSVKLLKLPTEIWYLVIAAIARTSHECDLWRQAFTLRSCTLVCRSWYQESLRYLYRSANLSGDDQTRVFIRTLRARPDFLQHLDIITNTLSKDGSRFHLVPMLLAGLPSPPLSLKSIVIASGDHKHLPLGRNTHDTFLKSYAYNRSSVVSLHLDRVSFDSFSYFARLLLSFRSLRHLSLVATKIKTLNDYPISIAKHRKLQLNSISWRRISSSTLAKMAAWFVNSDAFLSLATFSLEEVSSSRYNHDVASDINTCISSILYSAGSSIKDLQLTWSTRDQARESSSPGNLIDCSFNDHLESVQFFGLPIDLLTSVLSTLPALSTSLNAVAFDVDLLGNFHWSKVTDTLMSLQREILPNADIFIIPKTPSTGSFLGETLRYSIPSLSQGDTTSLRGVMGLLRSASMQLVISLAVDTGELDELQSAQKENQRLYADQVRQDYIRNQYVALESIELTTSPPVAPASTSWTWSPSPSLATEDEPAIFDPSERYW